MIYRSKQVLPSNLWDLLGKQLYNFIIFIGYHCLGSVEVVVVIQCCQLCSFHHAGLYEICCRLGTYFNMEWNIWSCPVWWNSVIFSISFSISNLLSKTTSCEALWLSELTFSQGESRTSSVVRLWCSHFLNFEHPSQQCLFAVRCTIDIHFSFRRQASPSQAMHSTKDGWKQIESMDEGHCIL